MFEQAVFPVQKTAEYDQLAQRIEAALAPNRADLFLASVAQKKLKIRQFEQILSLGLLGPDSQELYRQLTVGDQSLLREKYLARIEKVPAELRERFMKVYAYY
jgi:hypothetical protein